MCFRLPPAGSLEIVVSEVVESGAGQKTIKMDGISITSKDFFTTTTTLEYRGSPDH